MGTFDAFQRLVWSPQFKQNCFPHRSKMGVLKSFLKKVSCQLNEKIGKNGKVIEPGHSAYAYLCIDLQRSALEQLSLIEKVAEGSLSTESYESKIEKAGIFMLVSKRSIAPSKVLEIYYTRQEIEQVFDLGKNYAGMLPLSVQTEETFQILLE